MSRRDSEYVGRRMLRSKRQAGDPEEEQGGDLWV